MKPEPPALDWIDGVPHFRGLKVETRAIEIGPTKWRILAIEDAADLLDEPDFAKHFIEDDRAPYGMELWPAATMLAEYILTNDPGHDREALELGAGLGLVAMAATRAGWRVHLSDHEPTSLQFAAYNAALNEIEIHDYAMLDWHHPPADTQYPRIFAADVLYQLVDHAPILKCLDALLAAGGVALIADPCRGVADRFAETAVDHGFCVELIETTATNHRNEPVRGRIFRLTRVGMAKVE